eukprot:1974560-Ditylum_brightwellii.AAC.1
MATNRRFSCTKHTKHIKNRYFMIKDKIGQGEVIIQYCPTDDMWTDINTKALQGTDEDYHDDLERENTHSTLLPQEAQECGISDETREVLRKAGVIRTLLAATKTSLPDVQRNTQTTVAQLLLTNPMVRGTQESSSHCRSVLGDKGCTLSTVGKGVYKGPKPGPLDKQITDRRAWIQKIQALHCYVS